MMASRARARVLLVCIAAGCGPRTSMETDDGTTGTSFASSLDSSSSGSSSGWQPELGVYFDGTEPGAPTGVTSLSVTLLDLRGDGTVVFETQSFPCLMEPPTTFEARWVMHGDRLELEGMEPGSPPQLWPVVVKAWLEPAPDSESLWFSFSDEDGRISEPIEYRPGCACIPEPTPCCQMECTEVALQECPQGQFSTKCASM